MTTKNININGVNWKQRSLGKPYERVWYFKNQDDWMIPNKQLCAALGLHNSSLSGWAKKAEASQSADAVFIIRVYAPTLYVKLEGESSRKMQILWTSSGVNWLMNKSGFFPARWVKSNLQASKSRSFLLCAQDDKSCVNEADTKNACTAAPATIDDELTRVIKELGAIIQAKLPALTVNNNSLIQADVDSLRKLNFDLVLENEKHRSTIKDLKAKLALAYKDNAAPDKNDFTADNEEYYVPASFRTHNNSDKIVDVNYISYQPYSLSNFIKNKKLSYTVSELNTLGLFNATRLYLENFINHIDPTTGSRVNKNKFYDILRNEFVLTRHRAKNPKVLAAAEKENYAVVVKVVCPKMRNPTLPDGTILEKDNPAFNYSKEINLRPQIRYSLKAKKYIEDNWAMLCEDKNNGANKRKSYSGAKPELASVSSD